ncbi:ATP-binding cassette sub-family G member 2 [Auxenochlorella protothecoides]|uniref:ATP-binding cassette sub-family G member 2 n=1 Tax=Auxenochlorella protothecoides TaxID=3075 RepID=A0A087SN04_AUXPR|nr:ATP-binding cassette sub-family G member 2 [Auxenochlorella protothecoides]KFM27108.1 ATP-binding cassette sub-family G member 2 [Auxenochlorella protothecoides]
MYGMAYIRLAIVLAAVCSVTAVAGSCPTGFSGPQCGVCESDAACAAATNDSGATCSHDVAYASNSVTKSYACEMGTGFLASIVAPNTTYVTCHTGAQAGQVLAPSAEAPAPEAGQAPAPEAGGAIGTGNCDIGFVLNTTSVPVLCSATSCQMSAGALDVYCGDVTCACSGACPAGLIQGLVSSVAGTATMTCEPGGACAIAMEGLPIASIDVQCSVGECLVPVVRPLGNDTLPEGDVAHLSINPFIAAIPLLALVTLLAGAAAAEFVASLHDVPGQRGQWAVLGGITGTVHGGEVVGVLGPSGCGKTSLLGSLAGAAMDLGASAQTTGEVLVDGARRQKADVAYVPQSDVLIPSLTVQECLRYSALLRLPLSTSPMETQLRIEHVLDELALRHVADSQVGGAGRIRGISGGERRRVTIGMELVTDPAILVLDEPTSGLDSFTALNLMRTLHQVASGGRVVIASLHQPSHDMFLALDTALLMSHGRVLFQGRPADAEAWFRGRGLPCPAGTAMAEHLLKVASNPADIQALLLERGGQGADSAALLRLEDGGVQVEGGCAREGIPDDGASPSDTASASPSAADSPPLGGGGNMDSAAEDRSPDRVAAAWTPVAAAAATHKPGKLAVMTWRTAIDILRNPTLLRLHLGIGLLMGVVTGLVFWQLDDSNVGVQNRMGGTFFALAFLAFTSLTTVDLLINERAVVAREVRGGYYRPSAYLLSKLTLDAIFLRAIPAILYWAPFYYMAGFRGGAAYQATYLFILVTFSCAVGALSMAVTVASNTAGEASFGMNFIILFSIMFTGFLVNVSSIPAYLRWIHYLSVFFYAFEAMITNEMTGRTFTFMASGYAQIEGINGNTYLTTLGFDAGATTRDIGVLVGLYAGFTLLCLVLMQARMPHSRPRIKNIMRRLSLHR